jgi:predicted nucleic acid-binding Zn ribbon protein
MSIDAVLPKCLNCGKNIENGRKDKVHCSDKCRFDHWNAQHPRMVPWSGKKPPPKENTDNE